MLLQNIALKQFQYTLKNSPSSQLYGRRLYFMECKQKKDVQFWLKYDLNQHINKHTSFQHEIKLYLSLASDLHLPYQLMSYTDLLDCEGNFPLFSGQALLLPHAFPYFKSLPEKITDIQPLLLQACFCVQQWHHAGYIHGDLKREHFVVYQKKCYLIDFEQVQSMNNPVNHITATPHYMAPELFHGQQKSIQSDIYALGIIFYEWLNNERLTARNYHEWAVLHCQTFNPNLKQTVQCFQKIISKMLAKQKTERFNNIYDLQYALMQI